VKKSKTLF